MIKKWLNLACSPARRSLGQSFDGSGEAKIAWVGFLAKIVYSSVLSLQTSTQHHNVFTIFALTWTPSFAPYLGQLYAPSVNGSLVHGWRVTRLRRSHSIRTFSDALKSQTLHLECSCFYELFEAGLQHPVPLPHQIRNRPPQRQKRSNPMNRRR